MRLQEAAKQKKKVDLQLKSNRDLGESIQLIDYEQLRIENAEFVNNLEREHGTLKELKIITGMYSSYNTVVLLSLVPDIAYGND